MRIANTTILMAVLSLGLGVSASAFEHQAGCACVADLLGVGPAAKLECLSGPDFDKAYMQAMFQQQSDILALATVGTQTSSPGNFTDSHLKGVVEARNIINMPPSASFKRFYGKVRTEQINENSRLSRVACCNLTANCDRPTAILSCLACENGKVSGDALVDVMIAVLSQSRETYRLAMTKGCSPEVRSQAKDAAKAASKELDALWKWKTTGFLAEREQQRYCERYIYQPPYAD